MLNAPMVCLDATGTLIETTAPVGEVYARVAREHGVDLPAWRLDDAFRRVLRHAPTRGLAGATPAERRASEVEWWFERVRQTFQATDSTVRFADFRGFAQALFDVYATAACWRARPGTRALLARLAARGADLCVVSNFDHRLPEILEGLDLNHFFRFIEIPSRTGHAKPERAVFEAVAQASQRPLESLIYLGDDAPDVLEAIAEHGLRVFDVRTIPTGVAGADWLLEATGPVRAATLRGAGSSTTTPSARADATNSPSARPALPLPPSEPPSEHDPTGRPRSDCEADREKGIG